MAASEEQELERKLSELPALEAWQRAEALMELGWSRTGQSTPGIRPFLGDPAPLVRIAAAQALWQTDQDVAELEGLVAVLVAGLCQAGKQSRDDLSLDEDLSLMAGTALVQMESAAVGPLIRHFKNRGGKDALIIRVLGEIGDEEAKDFLVEASRSEIDQVASEAKEALAALTHDPS